MRIGESPWRVVGLVPASGGEDLAAALQVAPADDPELWVLERPREWSCPWHDEPASEWADDAEDVAEWRRIRRLALDSGAVLPADLVDMLDRCARACCQKARWVELWPRWRKRTGFEAYVREMQGPLVENLRSQLSDSILLGELRRPRYLDVVGDECDRPCCDDPGRERAGVAPEPPAAA